MENKSELPQTLQDAILYFSDPDVATQYVAKLRFPNGVVCVHCGTFEPYYLKTRRIWKCKHCGKQFSVKVGTIFEDSPIGLDKWLAAMWMIANAKNGISSYEIRRALGVTQKTAWFMLHRIRLANRLSLAFWSVTVKSAPSTLKTPKRKLCNPKL